MATPVGPAHADPEDPDLWDEWYQDTGDDDDVAAVGRFGWPLRLIALIALVGMVLVFVLA